ncbi:MAG: mannitol dehydrogenase family protein, partial [Kiritimatiellae bacterium]|nr:mannitol dehydrogenase family protein [Kiritimatiellia bacterium]
MKLSLESIINDAAAWQAKGVALPIFDIAAMRKRTAETPQWVHFGAGNIFRGFIGSLSQRLLDAGLAETGIIACDTFDFEVIDK